MATMLWECDICRTQYQNESGARLCEGTHPIGESFSITRVWFKDLQGLYGPDRQMAMVVPDSIRIVGANLSQGATYKLDYIGLKGV